ncbi:MAG: dihydropteroate synthase [Gemmataceae bacterium]|nr:dihydropteroate synthase [Gemmataceae bacterium]
MTHTWQLLDRVLTIGRRPLVMGIVNVTPDSFADGGRYTSTEAAVAHGLDLARQGADLLDVGGESTRPGSLPVSLEEELARVVPVVEALAAQTNVPLSVDTAKAEVARQCLQRGAQIINDVTALTGDPEMVEVVRRFGAAVVLMHMQGTPATMQNEPRYDDVVAEVAKFLAQRLAAVTAAGIEEGRVAVDPGIGFGKTLEHNLRLLARLEELQKLGRPVCLGVSRKGFIGRVLDRPLEDRLAGSLAAVCHAQAHGAVQVVRVHDVGPTRDAVTLFAAIEERTGGMP